MMPPEIKISKVNLDVTDKGWDSCDSTITLDCDLEQELYWRIVPNGTLLISIDFPISTTAAKGEALVPTADCLVLTPLSSFTIGDAEDGKKFSLEIPENQTDPIILKVAIKTVATPSIARCLIEYYDKDDGYKPMENGVLITVKKIADKIPEILSFKSSTGIFFNDDNLLLSWEVKESTNLKLEVNSKVYENLPFKGELKIEKNEGKTIYATLSPSNPTYTHISSTLEAKYHDGSGAFVYSELNKTIKEAETATEVHLMNIFTNNKKLYGLFLVKSPQKEDDVLMYESEDGINWQKNETGTFSKNKIPLIAASSPSVAFSNDAVQTGFNHKAYLIGGSRYDPGVISNDVYVYNFKAPNKGWEKETRGSFSKRMGHAVVAHKSGIFLLGGFGEDGALKEVEKIRFTKVSIFNETGRNDLAIVYEGKRFLFPNAIGVAYGNDRFEVLNKETGEKIMDTVLNIAGADDFQLREVVPGGKLVFVRSSLSGEIAVSGEYMKLKIANHAPNALPYEKIDVVVMSAYEVNGAYLRLDTLKGVGTDYNKELFKVKRSLLAGIADPLAFYRFSFINSASGEMVKDAKGRLYTSVTFSPVISRDNLYVFDFIEYADALDPDRAIELNGQTYDVETQLLWFR